MSKYKILQGLAGLAALASVACGKAGTPEVAAPGSGAGDCAVSVATNKGGRVQIKTTGGYSETEAFRATGEFNEQADAASAPAVASMVCGPGARDIPSSQTQFVAVSHPPSVAQFVVVGHDGKGMDPVPLDVTKPGCSIVRTALSNGQLRIDASASDMTEGKAAEEAQLLNSMSGKTIAGEIYTAQCGLGLSETTVLTNRAISLTKGGQPTSSRTDTVPMGAVNAPAGAAITKSSEKSVVNRLAPRP
ncbi:MAG: hypothetical protein WDO70_01870 [Alphaproteobacteria bacterium]